MVHPEGARSLSVQLRRDGCKNLRADLRCDRRQHRRAVSADECRDRYVIIDVEAEHSHAALEKLPEVEGTIGTRVLFQFVGSTVLNSMPVTGASSFTHSRRNAVQRRPTPISSSMFW